MKYIRTKDTIASVQREEDIELFKRVGQKVADTIEELCDEFVVIFDNKEPIISHLLGLAIFYGYTEYKYIYGAIWTSKGLIYVAKMNEKGELELL